MVISIMSVTVETLAFRKRSVYRWTVLGQGNWGWGERRWWFDDRELGIGGDRCSSRRGHCRGVEGGIIGYDGMEDGGGRVG